MILWFVARPDDRRKVLQVSGIVGAMGVIALVPYAWLVTYRRPVTDQVQLVLELTRRPDLLRGPEIYAGLILLGLIGKSWRQPGTLLTLSFALAPFIVFNQQVITGYSLQPFHYGEFIANYWVLIGLLLVFSVRSMSKRVLAYVAIIGLVFGLAYGSMVAKARLATNVAVDKGRAAASRLDKQGIVFAPNADIINSMASTGSNPVLWARYLLTFSHIDFQDQKLRFYRHLYYSRVGGDELRATLKQYGNNARFEIFGVERANPGLTVAPQPISAEEIEAAVEEYKRFAASFGMNEASVPKLSYAVVSPLDDLSNLDRWYERDGGERAEDLIIYRLRLR